MKKALTITGDMTDPQAVVLLNLIQTLLYRNHGLVRAFGITWDGKHETFTVETRDRQL